MFTDTWFWMAAAFSIGLFIGLSIERQNTKAEVRAAQLAFMEYNQKLVAFMKLSHALVEQAERDATAKESKQ